MSQSTLEALLPLSGISVSAKRAPVALSHIWEMKMSHQASLASLNYILKCWLTTVRSQKHRENCRRIRNSCVRKWRLKRLLICRHDPTTDLLSEFPLTAWESHTWNNCGIRSSISKLDFPQTVVLTLLQVTSTAERNLWSREQNYISTSVTAKIVEWVWKGLRPFGDLPERFSFWVTGKDIIKLLSLSLTL